MIDKLCGLLESDRPEVQCAAATVLGELKPKEPEARKALEKALKGANEAVRRHALDALLALGIEASLPQLVPLLGATEGLRSRVSQIFSEQGEPARKLLQDSLKKSTPEVRRGILGLLGRSVQGDSIDLLFESVMDEDFEVSRQATDSLIDWVKRLPDPERKPLLAKTQKFLASPKVKKNPQATVGGIKILGYLGNPASVGVLLAYVGKKNPLPVRTHALTAILHLDLSKAEKSVGKALLPLLLEKEFDEAADKALSILRRLGSPPSAADTLRKMLKGPHPAVRIYAAQALGQSGGAAAGPLLSGLLFDTDTRLADAAAEGLRTNPAFAPMLIKALKAEKDEQRAWRIANILKGYKKALGKPAVRAFLGQLLTALEKGKPGSTLFFEIVRSADPDALRDALMKRGRQLLTRKKYEEAEAFLKLLERDDLATNETLFVLAICRLRTLHKILSQASRDRSHALALFARLLRKPEFPLTKRLEKETAILTAEDYLYLGFCLVERQGAERDAGGAVLKFVTKKFKSRPEGKAAKLKLDTHGIK